MTRNNLDAHLSWLLQNVALAKPRPISLPKARDPSTIDLVSLSQVLPAAPVVGTPGSSQQVDRVPTAPAPAAAPVGPVSSASASTSSQAAAVQNPGFAVVANAAASFRDDFEDEEEVLAQAESMARLMLASKSGRPGLVMKQQQQQQRQEQQQQPQRQQQQQLPTPAPTSRPRTLQQAYEASLKARRTWSQVLRRQYLD